MNSNHHATTPTLSVIDPRTLAIRSVGYCRHPDSPEIDLRITRQRFDAPGRLVESWDPRLWGTTPKANLAQVYCLSDQPLLTDSADGGWQLSLLDRTGLPCSFWDARGSQRHTDYDAQRRPVAVTEQGYADTPRVVERWIHGGSAPIFAAHNQCGQIIRHDDPAGSQCFPEFGHFGAVLREERRFTTDLDLLDWPGDPDARDELLESQTFITCHTFNPTGELQCQTDAKGNVRIFAYDVAGRQREVWLQWAGAGKSPQRLVGAIHYNAHDQVERETAGNGVVTRAVYGADDGRLIRLVAQIGNEKTLQDLNYRYDPKGNIVELEDKSQVVTHFNNQRIEPINRYWYDSLNQLVEARGWEVSHPSHGPALPELQPTPLDPNQRRSYIQQFEYDRAGNLVTRHHSGTPGLSLFTSVLSNRSLAQHSDGSLPDEPEITSRFDACGNQSDLQRGQAMSWDIRNQLSRVTLVNRADEPDDYECYCYDRPGHRLRKVHFRQTNRRTLRTEVRYLPNLEIHRQSDGEEHHVIITKSERNRARALHWPNAEHDDQLRYPLSDQLGSSTLELDEEGGVLTWEHYYPFGGTACWAGKSAWVAKYKTFRYSGKERDATGLYYYGYRYYAPWLQRWIAPDPAGDISGPNRYVMVGNNPVAFFDPEGLDRKNAMRLWHHAFEVVMKKREDQNVDLDLSNGAHASHESEISRSDSSNGRVPVLIHEVANSHMQKPAGPEQIFILKKSNDKYSFTQKETGVSYEIEGLFSFVIPESDPDSVYVGLNNGQLNSKGQPNKKRFHQTFFVEGHSSLLDGKPVYFAGDIVVEDGGLKFWTDGSGHYQPTSEHRLNNLSDAVRKMLLDTKFRAHDTLTKSELKEMDDFLRWSELPDESSSSEESSLSDDDENLNYLNAQRKKKF